MIKCIIFQAALVFNCCHSLKSLNLLFKLLCLEGRILKVGVPFCFGYHSCLEGLRLTKPGQAVLLDTWVAMVWAVGMRGTWGSMISSGWWIIRWEKDVETLGLMRGVSKKGRNWLLCFFSMCLMCCTVSHSIHHASCIGKTLYALSCCRLQVSHHQQCRIEEPPEDSHTWTKS